MRALALGTLLLLLLPITILAQGNPNNPADFSRNPHPTMPWSGVPYPGRVNYGAVVRYIEVPPQPIALPVYVPGPGSFSGEYQPQLLEIPGYVVTETSTGYLYPERWGLQEVTQGVYRWVRLPQQFQPK